MKKAVIKKNGLVVIRNADVTTSFAERFRGLMFAQSIPDNYGLMITPCDQIHMFNMNFPLDVIYLSPDNVVVHIDENIRPWKVGKRIRGAKSVIEINAGVCAKCGINRNDVLNIEMTGDGEV